MTNVALYLYDETGTNLVKTITSAAENSGSFEWTVDSDITDGSYLVKVETIDGLESNDSGVFTIAEPGNLVVTVPYGCEEWLVGETHTISWCRDEFTARLDVKISLYNALGTTKIKDIMYTENDGTFEWMIDGDVVPGDYSIKICTVDETEEDFSNVFTISWPQGLSSFTGNEDGYYSYNSSDKSVKIGYNRGMESQGYVEGFKSGDKFYGPIMNSDSYEPNQPTPSADKDSKRILYIPKDKIKRAYPEQKRMKRTNRKRSAKRTGPTNIHKTQSMINTYYIWSFDGRLMAEYNDAGTCTREYIYLGNRLLAEYHPQTDKYYYHFQDQINSTRIVTDVVGNVVYSAAHGPYGDIQKVWVSSYDPKQKFSGKERESYTDLDYFGARYYDNHSYRFLSVDPVRNKDEAIGNPQLWNLYSYCRNNPVSYLDPDGRVDDFYYYGWIETRIRQENPELANAMSKGRLYGTGMVATGLAGFWAGYFAPEIAAALGPLIKHMSDKALRLFKLGKYRSAININKINHIFGKSSHNLNSLLRSFGGNKIKAFKALQSATQSFVEKNNITGVFENVIKVKDYYVTVRGKVVNGLAKIGTAFIDKK